MYWKLDFSPETSAVHTLSAFLFITGDAHHSFSISPFSFESFFELLLFLIVSLVLRFLYLQDKHPSTPRMSTSLPFKNLANPTTVAQGDTYT